MLEAMPLLQTYLISVLLMFALLTRLRYRLNLPRAVISALAFGWVLLPLWLLRR